jgi:hypothetical protein
MDDFGKCEQNEPIDIGRLFEVGELARNFRQETDRPTCKGV